jgi:hypothetical protein
MHAYFQADQAEVVAALERTLQARTDAAKQLYEDVMATEGGADEGLPDLPSPQKKKAAAPARSASYIWLPSFVCPPVLFGSLKRANFPFLSLPIFSFIGNVPILN